MVSRKGWFKTRMRYVLFVNYYLCGLSSKGDESESDAKRSSFENEKGGLEWEQNGMEVIMSSVCGSR